MYPKEREPPMDSTIRIAASVLSADFGQLASELGSVERSGADWIHVDVMDGRFVPNLTLGPVVVEALRRNTSLPLDVHLMIVEPERYVADFAAAGADIISIQVEAARHPERVLSQIRALGKRAGIVLNPHTPEDAVRYLLEAADLVLVMSVNPGFGGQRFMPSVLPKLRAIREWIDGRGLAVDLEVDGGITEETAPLAVAAGARVLVSGSALFGSADRARTIAALRGGTPRS